MMRITKKANVLIISMLLLIVSSTCGCMTDYYSDHYGDQESALLRTYAPFKEVDQPKLRGVTKEDELIECMEYGYIPIGTSSFLAPHCSWTFAIALAQEKGADIVLIDEKFKETKKYTSVLFLPSTQTSYTRGTASAYGRNGSAFGTYSGTTTTTSINAVPVEQSVDLYHQTAMFMRKANFADFFGTFLYIPKRVPGEEDNENFRVTILAVVKGSNAEKQGLKRGQVVATINGKSIKTRKDISPFQNNPKSIKSMEVIQ